MTKYRRIRVVIDTNVWVSYLLGGLAYKTVSKILKNKNVIILTNPTLRAEISDVIARPKFKKFFSDQQKEDLQYILTIGTENIVTHSSFSLSRDKDDNFLLAICYDGKADFLITGDEDLLILNPFKKTFILTVKDFESYSKV